MKKLLLVLLVSLGLQTQAQINPCDSIEYAITSTANNNVLQLEGWVNGICPVNFPCVVSDWTWTVCDDALCFSDTGQTVYFQQFMTNDTLKVCLDVIGTMSGTTFTCQAFCDSLVFGPNGWMLMSMGNPTGIEEFVIERFNDGKVYNITGREVFNLTTGVMYIRNNKKFIIVK
jgi:hypothetical protein